MSITSAKTGATGISLALENNFMEPIASVLVTASNSNTIIFNDIPQNYKHLQIRGITRSVGSNAYNGWFRLYVNNDTSPNYAEHTVYGDGSSAGAWGGASQSAIDFWYNPDSNTGSGTFAASVVDVLDYTNTNKYKTFRGLNGCDANISTTRLGVQLASAVWLSTNPITSLLFSAANGNFAQYSRFSLYGIKG